MRIHLNSQAKGPKLDRSLERVLYHRRGNFLNDQTPKKLEHKLFSEKDLGKISQVYRQSHMNYIGLCLFFIFSLKYSINYRKFVYK